MSNKRKTVMVSSTARDLPDHRKEVMDACLRQGMFPVMMEHLPASDAEAISASLKMVDEADIYVGIYAYRYGYIPKENNPKEISVTEMEYDRAVKRGIPRLIFVMDKSHPITADDMDIENAEKLQTLKNLILKDNIVNFFKSPADLRAHVINSLSQYRDADVTKFHFVSDIPQPPDSYIAHPYTLLQTHKLVGRQKELNLLTSWVTKAQDLIYRVHIMNIVAIGGMGKSALTWKWFNDIAPQEMKPLAGRMWWSFYESDATFENFVIRALAYVSERSREDIEKNTNPGEREEQLLQILDHEPYLLVLDGLERILIAYARMDAARLSDDDIDQRTANFVTKVYGLPESASQSFVGQHQLRKSTDPRAGSFFRKLASTRSARILVSTRLYPADLQSVTGEPIRGCSAIFLPGLSDDDALNLWRAFNVSGSRESLLPLFNKFENHPLLMQSLASEVATYRRAPRDFERWQKDHPNFNPYNLPLTQVKGHVLGFAMRGLYENARKVLETIAGFRMPAQYDTLTAIFVGEDKTFPTEIGLDQALRELEDRGLLGWDKRANRYDLHPIVRGVVWNKLTKETQNGVLNSLQAHFDSIPTTQDEDKISSIGDLTPAIELYSTLIRLEQFDDAFNVYQSRIAEAIHFRLGDYRYQVEFMEMLFPDGTDKLPRLGTSRNQSFTLNLLAYGYNFIGQPERAVLFFQKAIDIDKEKEDLFNVSITLSNLSASLRIVGKLYEAELAARHAFAISTELDDQDGESTSLENLGVTLSTRGSQVAAAQALARSLKITNELGVLSERVFSYQSQQLLWKGDFDNALLAANRANKLAQTIMHHLSFVRTARLQGIAALRLESYSKAEKFLTYALTHARAVNLIEEELSTIVVMAELQIHQGNLQFAIELLNSMWEYVERGPYPLFHVDSLNVFAKIEHDQGNKDKAIEAATKAYRLAWCDGPPYAYHWGLEKAKQHLKELGAPEPEMPPFDESKFEPMPEVEINPKDEFWVDPEKEFDIDELLKDK